jgi:mono/diheme cytochrome c family protein
MKLCTGTTVIGIFALGTLLALPASTDAQTTEEVTFTKDVAPILQASCQTCHRDGAIAPMSLMSYDEARPWARAIKDKVVSRTMPPWYIDKNIGVQGFRYDRSLSDDQIATIAAWVDAGAPRGNPADMPPPQEFAARDIWHIGEPDWIIPIPEPFVVPAEGANWWGDFFADSGLTEDRWIKAVETKPSSEGFPVVHHAVTRVQESADSTEGDFLNEYAQGKNGDAFPPGTGRLVKAGTVIRFNMHYASIGEERADRTSVGLQFYPLGEEPEHELFSRGLAQNYDLDIPPGEDNVRHDSYHKFEKAVRLTGFQPHLHNRGKRQCIEAIYPDATTEMLSCATWDFGWHIVYNYLEDVQPLLPAGTMMHTTTWHDNSAANRWNPDARNWAGFGQRSSDDMSFTWTSFYELEEDEFAAAVAEREALADNNN